MRWTLLILRMLGWEFLRTPIWLLLSTPTANFTARPVPGDNHCSGCKPRTHTFTAQHPHYTTTNHYITCFNSLETIFIFARNKSMYHSKVFIQSSLISSCNWRSAYYFCAKRNKMVRQLRKECTSITSIIIQFTGSIFSIILRHFFVFDKHRVKFSNSTVKQSRTIVTLDCKIKQSRRPINTNKVTVARRK